MQLSSERLTLIKYTSADFAAYFELAGDARVMQMITGKSLTEEEAKTRFQKILDTNTNYPAFGYFIVSVQGSGQHIGLGKLTPTSPGEAEVGYMLSPESWGKGFGTEISNCLIQYARTLPKLHTLMAIIDPVNAASKRILEKAGFRLSEVCDMGGLPAEIYRMPIEANLNGTF